MKDLDFTQMTEDELFEIHCESSHELADLSRMVINANRRINELADLLDRVDIHFETLEAKTLKEENKLN